MDGDMNTGRVQRSRRRGWRMPQGAVYVGRPTKWGNPYRMRPETAVEVYRDRLVAGLLDVSVEDVRRELRGRVLVCWCPLGRPCHADVLIDVANEGEEQIEHSKNRSPAQPRMFPKHQGTCLHCRRKITANTSKEWSKLVKSQCPHCGRPGW